jgi:hypothetical protein
MAATPLAQSGDCAVATKCTGDETCAPLLGLVTVTPANADVAKVAKRQTYSFFFMRKTSPLVIGNEVAQASNEWVDSKGLIFYLQENSRVDERFFD